MFVLKVLRPLPSVMSQFITPFLMNDEVIKYTNVSSRDFQCLIYILLYTKFGMKIAAG